MDALLQGVLSGALPLKLALDWALSSSDDAPPPELRASCSLEQLSPTHSQALPFRPADFQVHILNHVREQAELILAAAEQEAGPSHPPTPDAQSKGQGQAAPAQQAGGAASAAQQQQQQQRERQQAQLLKASRRLEPGLLDDDNFPSLGRPAPKPGASPTRSKKQGPKRTIVPAKVEAAAAAAHPAFVAPPGGPPSQAAQAVLPSSPPPVRLARPAAEPATTPPPPVRAPPPAATPPPLSAAREAAAVGATPKRRMIIPTRIDGSSLQVSESFLVSPLTLQQTPASRTPTAAASLLPGGTAARSPLQLTPLEEQEVCVQLRFDAAEEDSLPAAAAAAAATRGTASAAGAPAVAADKGVWPGGRLGPEEAVGRLERRLAGIALAGSKSEASAGASAAQQQQQHRQRQVAEGGSAAVPGPGSSGSGSVGKQQDTARSKGGGVPPGVSGAPIAWGRQSQQQQQQQQQPAAAGASGLSYASVTKHPQSPTKQRAGGKHHGINPQLRNRLEAEPSGTGPGRPGSPSASSPATPAVEGMQSAVATPPTEASLGPDVPSVSSGRQPKYPSPMEAVFMRLDAKASSGGEAGQAAAVAAAAGPSSSEQRAAWPGLAAGSRGPVTSGGGGNAALPRSAEPNAARVAVKRSPLSIGAASELQGISDGRQGAGKGSGPGAVAAAQTSPARVRSPQRRESPQKRPAPVEEAAPAVVAPEPSVQLSSAAERLAQLHSGLLRCCSMLALSAELDLLMNLLAVPASVHVDPQLSHITLLWCGELAQQYACCVLQGGGSLVRGLGPQLLADLAALPILQAPRFSGLLQAVQAALRHFQSTQLHTEKAYDQVKAGSSMLSLFGLPAFTNDGKRSRTQEEQRRVSNRENCRDEWFNLMKEAAAQTHSFAVRQLGGGRGLAGSGAASDRLSDIGSKAGAGDESSVLQLMQSSATDLLRRLRPDNYAAFAELFVAAVLQAAATGETILDEELSRLAKKNLSKFQQLNQRMQAGQGAPGPRRGGAARQQLNQPATVPGFGRQQQQQQRLGAPRARPGKGGGGGSADEGVAASLQLISEFPQAQRLYVMFLEAADSHRLNSSVIRCMASKLKSLTGPGSHGDATATPAALGERVVATSTLASFLSYLCFAHAGSGAADIQEGSAYDGSHPIDVRRALEAAAAEGSSLAWTVPWVVRYLWFLGREEEGPAHAPYFRAVLARLQQLRQSRVLTPQDPSFGLAAFCLRSVLDEFAKQMGPQLMPCELPAADLSLVVQQAAAEDGLHRPASPQEVADTPAGAVAGESVGGVSPASRSSNPLAVLAGCDSLLDRRYVQLCCPALDHAQQLFRSKGSAAALGSTAGGASGKGGSGPGSGGLQRRVKKIRPTAPSGLAAARVALQVPAALQSAAEAGQDVVKLRLQRAFLEQYSTEEHKVKLKDVVDYVADIIGYNAATSVADTLVQPAIDAAVAQLIDSAEGISVSLVGEGRLAPSMESAVRLYVENQAEQLIAATCTQVLQQGQAAAAQEVEVRAVQAMLSLTPPGLGEAVIGTAAAIVAEVASAACAQRLLSQVPSQVRQGITGHIDAIMKGVNKGRISQLAANAATLQRAARGAAGSEPKPVQQ